MGTQTATRWGVDGTAYSAVWSVVNAGDLIRAVEDQFESWLRTKGSWDPQTETSGYRLGPQGQELLVVHRDGAEGLSLRLRLIEANNHGTWRTSVTVNQSVLDDSWVGLQVANSGGTPAKVPRLATFLLEALELHDGDTWLSAKPQRVSGPDIERVAEEVTDLGRQGLYFVAGTDESLPFSAFSERVERWTADTRGMAQVVVLDPVATREFASIVGASHAVPPGTIRTFDTDVDPAIAADGRRHRILGTRRLAGSDAAVRAILGHATRAHAAQRPLPGRFSSVHRALTRMEDKLLVDTLLHSPSLADGARQSDPADVPVAGTAVVGPAEVQAPAPAVDHQPSTSIDQEATRYLAQVELVKEVLGIAAIDRDTLADIGRLVDRTATNTDAVDRVMRQLDERRERIEELEFERDVVREVSDDQELELADALATQVKLADEVRWLRRRLAEHGDAEGGHGILPAEEETRYPSDFVDLADLLGGLEPRGVIFTGDMDVVCGLADQDPIGRVAGVAWDCLLTLCDYVRARDAGDHTQGVRQFLETTPQGYRSVPPKKFAAKETAATMQAWGDLRSFPVPTSVALPGEVHMEAHFKLGRVGMVSPRMYYFDNYSLDGKLYVGYIGSHLRNTKTN